jgi:carboxyl-terminal processing protease
VWPAAASDPADTRIVSLIRDKVKLERAAASVELREVPGPAGEALSVAVIDVPAFYVDWSLSPDDPDYRSASTDVRRILGELAPGTDAVVVDLRSNGGGSLDEAILLTGLFIDQGPVVQTRDARGEVDVLRDTEAGTAWDGPLTVLTSVYSASASEIFAAAVQDHQRGLVVGAATTHGKGTVQNVFDLGRLLSRTLGREQAEAVGGALKYTTQKFYRVNGGSTQHRGVIPDVIVPSHADGLDIREADLDYALPYDEIAAIPVETGYELGVDLEALRRASEARVSASLAFQYMAEDRAEREAREGRPLALNLETRRAELDENEREREARLRALGITPCPEPTEPPEGVDPGDDAPPEPACEEPQPDPILDETLAIVADWTRLATRPGTAAVEDPAEGPRRRRGRDPLAAPEGR